MIEKDKNQLEGNPTEVGFQVDGKILNELSKQVSSHLFALGELMKNSYDAEATRVNIIFDIKNKQLTVEDNGVGISKESFESLLHIAKSGKEYGREFEFCEGEKTIIRYTQGSKGLGLFCAFKFGDLVTWDTMFKGESYKLKVDKADIVKLPDISKVKIPLEEGNRVSQGTTITMSFELDSEIDYIYSFFLEGRNSKKIVKYFYAEDMEVSINLINEDGNREKGFPMVSMPASVLNNEHDEAKVLDIDYDSENGKIIFTHKNGKAKEIEHPFPDDIKDTSIKFHINAYSLKARGIKKIDEIFHNERAELSPLVYINGVMFNNDQFFDPSITRKIKSSKTLPQLTGFVRVVCTNSDLQFNNERTDLIQNSFNKKLKDSVNKLNELIQEKGKEFLTEIRLSKEEKISQDENVVEMPQVNPQPTIEPPPVEPPPAELIPELEDDLLLEASQLNLYKESDPIITLTQDKVTLSFDEESDSINLRDYFVSAKDSQGNKVSIEAIKIFVDDVCATASPYIPSVSTNKQMSIKFSFKDSFKVDFQGNPFEASKSLMLVFKKKEKKFGVGGKQSTEKFIKPIKQGYTVKIPGVDRLIEQLNKLAENYEDYDICISSSIRLIFDLTTYRYQQYTGEKFNNNSLDDQVKEVIISITGTDNKQFSKVTELLSPRHRMVKSLFYDPGLFSKKVAFSNLGTHTGTDHVSLETLKDIALHAGYYAQLVDSYLKVKGFIAK